MKNVFIAGYVRSPFHFAAKGALTRVRPDDMLAAVIQGLLQKTGVPGGDIEDLIVGCAMPEGEQGLNVARLTGLLAGLPISVAGTTVNRFCGSSMQAIHMAAGAIQLGAGEAFIAGGMESMTRVPLGGFNPMPNPRLRRHQPGLYLHGRDGGESRRANTRSGASGRSSSPSTAMPAPPRRRRRASSPMRSSPSPPAISGWRRTAASARARI